jgi:pyruvate kinase
MDVARLNFSHGDHAGHARTLRRVRSVASEVGRPLGVLADLAGPKIRVGEIPGGERRLRQGGQVVLSSRLRPGGSQEVIGTTYRALARDVARGCAVLLDDGRIRLRVSRIDGDRIRCHVVEGGVLRSHKGINLPGVPLSAPALTAKDRDDLALALEEGADLVALSFVRRARDVRQAVSTIRRLVGAPRSGKARSHRPPYSEPHPPVIAKLEKPEALDDLDGILSEAGAVMVARGDLGVEIPPERVPTVQKHIIRRANTLGRPVITATQMLESMTERSRPTRAEASDVANAVLDGTDAVMLSAETATGRYPVEAVRMMDRIIRETELQAPRRRSRVAASGPLAGPDAEDAVAGGAVELALELDVACIVAFTRSGSTALRLARRRPPVPIVVFSPEESVVRRLSLVWGVTSRSLGRSKQLSSLVRKTDLALREMSLARNGDRVVLVMGYPPGRMGRTDLVKVHVVAEAS